MKPPPDISLLSLAEVAALAEGDSLPPVERWHPDHCGDSEMRIARDGTWYHQGSTIGRQTMVRAFSRILRREPDGSHVLVTPVEKLDIEVEDAAFVAIRMKSEGEGRTRELVFQLNTGDLVIADADHPISFRGTPSAPRPYLAVRGGLEALVSRNVYYELANIALDEGSEPPSVWSRGVRFALEPAG